RLCRRHRCVPDFYHSLHQPMPGATGILGASPGLTIPVDIPPFHFQPRRVSVDWRRFSAIDVEQVAREVDVATLQEHISGVTFCNLDGERCPHCGQPADPVLLKVLRMAQLSIEYLLHCQECLGTSLAMHTQCLRDAHAKLACIQQQAAEQAAQLRGAKEESRRWKKLIAMQQLFLQAGPNTHCKCHLCGKAFMNNSFLQAHVQRRHAEATEAGEHWDNFSLHFPRQVFLHSMRDLERWKEEERMKMHEEIDGLRQIFLEAFKDVASRSSAMEAQEVQVGARCPCQLTGTSPRKGLVSFTVSSEESGMPSLQISPASGRWKEGAYTLQINLGLTSKPQATEYSYHIIKGKE
uniref:C2H2-type domain-containing protein n=1 Tax=Falco tinnunculus TaxID=100819 RepID=A0A8C4UJY8_FALTI